MPVIPPEWQSFELLQATIDTFPDPIFVKDREHRWIACNQAFCRLVGQPYDKMIGYGDLDYFPPEQAKVFLDGDNQVMAEGGVLEAEEQVTSTAGEVRTIWTRKFPLRNRQGELLGVCGIITDITAIKARQAQIEQLERAIQDKAAIIEAQAALLDQLSVPVIQVWDGILLLPLIGVIDSRRAGRILENLLEAIGRHAAQVVIVDITGVPVVDTSVASYLVRSVQAAQLLGCRSVLVGISAEIAQTLVGLGVNFSQIATRATLQNGLEYALEYLQIHLGA
jgi:rsbT co-antagonist protein RsbR